MTLDLKPASDYSLPDLLYLLNLSFEEYLVPVTFNLIQFLTMLRKDSVDLYASRVLVEDGEPAGIALIARRGWTSRLAAMGIVKEARGTGAGTRFMQALIQHEAGKLISQYGLPDLPWQLNGETITHLNPPARAYRDGQAYAVISSPDAEHVVIWSVLVEPSARGHGLGTGMVKRVMANHPGKTWHVSAILPEELGGVFEGAGFEREELSQWQMRLILS
jgi:GNAT superfamily N-acetyltransferase